jgi:hypothetical protein
MQIKCKDSFVAGRPLQHFGMAQRPSGIAIARSPMLLHTFVNSGLVGSESTATLEHQGDAFKGRTSFRHCDVRMDLNVHGMLSMSRGTKTSASDPDADANLNCENRQGDYDDQRGCHGLLLFLRNLLLPIALSRISKEMLARYSSAAAWPPLRSMDFLNTMSSGTTASVAIINSL